MESILEIPAVATTPPEGAVLAALGYTAGRIPDPRSLALISDAFALLEELGEPKGMYRSIAPDRFAQIHRGEGRNERPNPLETIYPRADHLALFAVTLGPKPSERIRELFEAREFALGAVFDAVASEAAEQAGVLLEEHLLNALAGERASEFPGERAGEFPGERAGELGRELGSSITVLRYSPGYCGWDLSGQRALFGELHPKRIGLHLNDRCLMTPAKSITGVMVAGRATIHAFENDFTFCASCRTKTCRARIRALQEGGRP